MDVNSPKLVKETHSSLGIPENSNKVNPKGPYRNTLPSESQKLKKKRVLRAARKVMTNLDSILKSRDITLPSKVRLDKAMVFPVVMYGC